MAPRHLVDIIRHRLSATPTALAFQTPSSDGWRDHDWSTIGRRVRHLSGGLRGLGLGRGDRIAILCTTRLEWILADLATLCAGASVTTIYPSSTAEECAFILEDAQCTAVFVEDAAQLAKLDAVADQLPGLQHRILLTGPSTRGAALSLLDLEARGAAWDEANPEAWDLLPDQLSGDDLACVIYTSGTTGPPKGVMLSHDGFVAVALAVEQLIPLDAGDKQYLFLPLSHVYGKILELLAIHVGVPTVVDGSIQGLVGGLAATEPTFLAGVPRVFEKMQERILARVDGAGPRRAAIFHAALDVGRKTAQARRNGERVGLRLRLAHELADRVVFSKVRAGFGGQIRAFASGGAPISQEVLEFFHAMGILILEGYGMTESSALTTANRLDDFRFGSVGKPGPGVDVRIAKDGEVLIRGRSVMRGYNGLPEATASTLAEGWLHTGDIGSFDGDGYLFITDRKKNLIITSGGKNIAPAPIQHRIVDASPLVGQALLHGDRRKFCVAMVALDGEALASWAARHELRGDFPTLARHARVQAEVGRAIDAANAGLPPHASVKKHLILDHELTVENGLLTPTMKVRRKQLEARYAAELDALYEVT